MHQVIESIASLQSRRRRVIETMKSSAALLAAGCPRPRNYSANSHTFRASSHFLYLTGVQVPGAALLLLDKGATLFMPAPGPDDALWHGPSPSMAQFAAITGCDDVKPIDALPVALDALASKGIKPATLPTADLRGCQALSQWLGRPVAPGALPERDAPLADAMINARLYHDEAAIAEMTSAAALTAEAFAAGRAATRAGEREWVVRAAMTHSLAARGVTTAYSPIVSVHGEVLHNESSHGVMANGDLLLVDFGAESAGGWACDVTRTWPVSGTMSATQQTIHELVLDAQRAAIDAVAPGVRYRDVHLAACLAMTKGLVSLGILRGDAEELVADGVHALFFPHGVGHLLGLDVHDMEDLGDRAGYAKGRQRSAQFGLNALRLDRDLAPGMVVTIEPGFYQVPAILEDPARRAAVGDRVNFDALAPFSDVRGVRIEDDILVTDQGSQNLTAAIPK